MRIRSTKPEFWRSKTIAEIDWETRFILKGLESYVDDNGVGKDDLEMVAADVFPRDLSRNPRETLARLSRGFLKLAEANLIVRYTFNGEALVYVRRWKSIQRVDKPNQGRYPRPDGSLNYSDQVDESVVPGHGGDCRINPELIREDFQNPRETLANTPETLAPGTEEQRNRGTEEKQTCATALRDRPPPRFAEFWAAYPRRRDRRKAEKAFTAALKRADAGTIIDGAHRYAQDRNRQEQFTKYAEGWLNGDGWLDEPLPDRSDPATNGYPPHKLRSGVELAARLKAEEQHKALVNQTLKELE